VRLSRIFFGVLLCGAFTLIAHADPPAPAAPSTPGAAPRAAISSHDGWFAAASAVGVAASALGDRWAWRQSQGDPGSAMHRLSRFAQRFGDPVYVGPALLAGYAAGRFAGLPDISAPSARVAGAALGAAVLCGGFKLAVGRARPGEAPDEPGRFDPLSLHDSSFPSMHTTIAFATAAAIDAESGARWVPWTVYPIATAVGWARVHENRHWLSDVTAGAALGFWAGRKVDARERGHGGLFERARFMARGSRRNFRVGFQTKF